MYTDLVHVSASSTGSVTIHSELARCTAKLDQSFPPTQLNAQELAKAAKLQVSKSLACFIESQCPFGPIDQVQLEHQVQLDTSTYLQVLRIYAPVFYLTLEYKLGDSVITRFTLEETSPRALVLSDLQAALSPAGINMSIPTFQLEIGGAERTVEIQYSNVALPAFSIVVSNTSVPAYKMLVEQILLRSAPRIRLAPRQVSKVYQANSSSMNSTAPPTTVIPSTRPPTLANYSSQCVDCVERYLKGACRRSVFCQSIMLPCVAQSLISVYSSIYTGTVDVRASIAECIELSSNSERGFFYDWWAPLKRFFVCFAREKCPTNTADALTTEMSVLHVEPGTIEFVYASASTSTPLERATAVLEIMQSGPGSSFSLASPYYFTGYRSGLINVLQHMTQGRAATFTVDVEELPQSSSGGSDSDAGVSIGSGSTGVYSRSTSNSGSNHGSAGVDGASTSNSGSSHGGAGVEAGSTGSSSRSGHDTAGEDAGSTSDSGTHSGSATAGVDTDSADVGTGSTSRSGSHSGEAGVDAGSDSSGGSEDGSAGVDAGRSRSNSRDQASAGVDADSTNNSGSGTGSAGVGAGSTSGGSDDAGNGYPSSVRRFRVRIAYSDEFLGFIPTISGTQIVAGSTRIIQPKISVRPADTPTGPRKLNWGALRAMLQTESQHGTTALSRNQCDRNFATSCQQVQVCQQQVVPCLLTNLPRAGSEFSVYGTDLNFVQATYQCSWSSDATRPVTHLVACYEDAQWATGADAATHSPTHLRTAVARQRFQVNEASSAVSLQTRVSARIYAPGGANGATLIPFAETLEELRSLLGDVTAASEINVRLSSDSSRVGPHEFEIEYERALGTLPSIQGTSDNRLAVKPDSIGSLTVLFTSDNSLLQTSMHFLLGAFERALSCNSVCEEYFKACVTGDSQTSLNCRERILPCVSNALSNLESPTSGSTTAISIKDAVRQCSQLYTLQAFHPIQEFLLCYGSSSCTANNAYETGVVPSYLAFTPTSQLLHVELSGTAPTISMQPPGRANVLNFVIANKSNLHSLETFIKDELLNDTASNVAVLPMGSDGTSFAEYQIDYYGYMGALPSLSTGNGSESWQSEVGTGDLALTSPKPWNSSTLLYDRLQARLEAHLPRALQSQSRPCSSCFDMLTNCAPCRQTVLPCLMDKLSTTIDYTAGEFQQVEHGTGTEFGFAVRMCGVGLLFPQWALVGDAFQCLMDNACLLSDASNGADDPSSTFMIVKNASQAVFALDKDVIELQVAFQQEGTQFNPNAPGYVTIPLDRPDDYAALSQLLNEYLRDAGRAASIAGVTKFNEDFGLVLQEVTINYTGLYGYTPAFGSPVFEDIHAVHEYPATFTLQSLESTSPNWEPLVDELVVLSTTEVLAGECATCAASLFGCALTDIANGSCSFSAVSSRFTTCLRDSITRAEFAQALKGSAATVVDVTSHFTVCLDSFVENESSTGIRAENDLWFTTTDALACWEGNGCPFGPLSIVVSDTTMIQLTSSPHEETFTIHDATSFSAVFVVQATSSRTLTTESFTEASADSEIELLLAAVLPQNVHVAVEKIELDTEDGWTVQVSCSMLYLPAVSYTLGAGDATVTSSILGVWDVMLENVPLEASTMVSLF